MPAHTHSDYVPLIFVKSIYTPNERREIREKLFRRLKEVEVGMGRFRTEVLDTVSANNKRIRKPCGASGLYVDQLSERNLRHYFDGRRSQDVRVQILDAYCQIIEENPPASHLII